MPSQRQGFPPELEFGFWSAVGYPVLISGADNVHEIRGLIRRLN